MKYTTHTYGEIKANASSFINALHLKYSLPQLIMRNSLSKVVNDGQVYSNIYRPYLLSPLFLVSIKTSIHRIVPVPQFRYMFYCF